jgi:YVTN family beta-propeller protein
MASHNAASSVGPTGSKMARALLLVLFAACSLCNLNAQQPRDESPRQLLHSPAGEKYVELNAGGTTILPNGRLITPRGPMIRVQPHPYGLAASADWVVTVSSDGPQLSLLDLRGGQGEPVVYRVPDEGASHKGVLDAAFMGLAIDSDSQTLYVAGGKDWSVRAFDLKTRKPRFRIDAAHPSDGRNYEHGFLGDLRLTRDGKWIFAVDQSNYRLLIIDVENRRVMRSIGVGRSPFGITLSPDEQRAYVANVGIYEYSYFEDKDGNRAKLPFPPFGVPSREAREGVVIDGIRAAGLGDSNDLRGMSVWTVDVSKRGAERVIAREKTGHLVGEQLEAFPAVGGSSPNSVVATDHHVFVSNGSNDSITVIDARTGKRVRDIDLALDARLDHLRGMIPFGLALSPKHDLLYVAEAGINAIGVVRLADWKVLGHIPTAWFPSKLSVAADNKRLYVACAKGIGSGPNAGPGHKPGDPTGIGSLMRGYINIIPLPENQEQLDQLSRQVVANNVAFTDASEDPRQPGFPVPPFPQAWKSPIKHVIYVTKENRTYDEVFGVLPGGRGDKDLCRLGRPIDVSNRDGSRTVKDVLLMPNHLALARRFAVNDNFYCDSDHSVDGHRWLVGTYPNEFMESRIGESASGDGPGNHSFIGSSGAIYPEDYNEGGSIWEHFERNRVSFWNYGLGFEFKPQEEERAYKYTGIRLTVNYPMPKVLFENTSREFATYNTNIPDQFRMDMFEKEFKEKWLSGKQPFPDVITMMLPNDHGAGERPNEGYPFWGSYMSDNDLALGRLVELISHSPFWQETVIFVTEDDAQGYRDTVDAHRSICMVISPYAKRDHVSHTHGSTASMLKTLFLIQGMPALNQYDGCASDLADMFTHRAENGEPYRAVPVNAEIFDRSKAVDPSDPNFDWNAAANFVPLDHQPFLDADRYGHRGKKGHGPRKNGD